jgi:hypothetical protein
MRISALMKRLGKRRRRAAVACGFLVVLSSVVGVATVVGAIPTPSPVISNAGVAPAPASTGVVTAGPMLSHDQADLAARTFAAGQAAEPAPSSQQSVLASSRRDAILAVNTSQTQLPANPSPAMDQWLNAPAYVEVLHGHFTLGGAPHPPGADAPTGSALSLVIDAHTGQVSAITLRDRGPDTAALSHLGTVRSVG